MGVRERGGGQTMRDTKGKPGSACFSLGWKPIARGGGESNVKQRVEPTTYSWESYGWNSRWVDLGKQHAMLCLKRIADRLKISINDIYNARQTLLHVCICVHVYVCMYMCDRCVWVRV